MKAPSFLDIALPWPLTFFRGINLSFQDQTNKGSPLFSSLEGVGKVNAYLSGLSAECLSPSSKNSIHKKILNIDIKIGLVDTWTITNLIVLWKWIDAMVNKDKGI